MELCPEKHRHRQYRIGQGRGDHIDGEHLRGKGRQLFPVVHIAGPLTHRIGGDTKACKQQKIPADGACKVHFAQVFHLKNIGSVRECNEREDNIHQCLERTHRCIQTEGLFHSDLHFVSFSGLFLFQPAVPEQIRIQRFYKIPILPCTKPA